MKKFFKFAFAPHKKQVAVILLFVILQAYFQLEIINLFKSALKHLKSESLPSLISDGQTMLVYTLILIGVMIAVLYMSNKVSSEIAHETRQKIFHILTRLPPAEINQFKSTGLMARTTRGVFTEQGFIQIFLKNILIIPFVTVGIIIAITVIDLEFAMGFTVFVIVLVIFFAYKIKNVTDVYFKAKKTYGAINSQFRDKVTGLKTIHIFKKKFFEREKFNEAVADSYDKSLKFQLAQYYISPAFLMIFNLFVIALMIFLFDLIFFLGTEISRLEYLTVFAELIIVIQYMLYFSSTLMVMPYLIEIWPRAYATSIRIEEVLVLEDKINEENKSKTRKSDFNGIEFKNVSFESEGREIIKNVSFKVPDKSTVAIVGPYSSGKTLLMYLLDGLYEASEGEILLDGYDIRDLTSAELRGKINFAIQKSFLFNDTVYNNIAMGHDVSREDMDMACERAGLKSHFSDEFNLDTVVLENASNISSTFKRKIMLARSLVRDKEIYIFDDYDFHVEDRTNFILTRDISRIKEIEHIIVLDKGEIVGEGSHDELASNCAVYQQMMGGDEW